jgi:hypothetical protein
MSLPPGLSLVRTYSDVCAASAATPFPSACATPAASWKDDDDDGILPKTDTLVDEVQLLQDTLDEFFVRLRQVLEELERRTTA